MFKRERILRKVVIDINGCWNWHPKTVGRYPSIHEGGIFFKANRYSFLAFKGEITEGLCVLHTCDNTQCCNPNHLYLGDQKQNALDRKLRGREGDRSGIKNGRTKLSEEQVDMIRSYDSCIKHVHLSKIFNVTPETISNIRRGKNWIKSKS